ncbi:glycosyltransferase family 2 protein, partial [Niallia taxi]
MELSVSLCMIVKNEESVLDRCLASVAHLVDEVIIVDTGSTDKTKEIASKYTSKIFDFEWINDFSAARNFAAEQATGDWILVLDADEYIDEENYQEFVDGLKEDNGQFDTYGVKIINFTGLYGEKLIQNHH